MLIGIGSDLCDIRRIQSALDRFGERFIARSFTEHEQRRAMARTESLRAATFAKRWAAKEACAKALGTGFARGVFHSSMGVRNLPSGQPTMELTDGAAARLAELLPPGTRPQILLTITDEPPYAFAQVMISALPIAG